MRAKQVTAELIGDIPHSSLVTWPHQLALQNHLDSVPSPSCAQFSPPLQPTSPSSVINAHHSLPLEGPPPALGLLLSISSLHPSPPSWGQQVSANTLSCSVLITSHTRLGNQEISSTSQILNTTSSSQASAEPTQALHCTVFRKFNLFIFIFLAYTLWPVLVTPVPLSSRNCHQGIIHSRCPRENDHPAWDPYWFSDANALWNITIHPQMGIRHQGNLLLLPPLPLSPFRHFY